MQTLSRSEREKVLDSLLENPEQHDEELSAEANAKGQLEALFWERVGKKELGLRSSSPKASRWT